MTARKLRSRFRPIMVNALDGQSQPCSRKCGSYLSAPELAAAHPRRSFPPVWIPRGSGSFPQYVPLIDRLIRQLTLRLALSCSVLRMHSCRPTSVISVILLSASSRPAAHLSDVARPLCDAPCPRPKRQDVAPGCCAARCNLGCRCSKRSMRRINGLWSGHCAQYSCLLDEETRRRPVRGFSRCEMEHRAVTGAPSLAASPQDRQAHISGRVRDDILPPTRSRR